MKGTYKSPEAIRYDADDETSVRDATRIGRRKSRRQGRKVRRGRR